jgi:hypothetical protein
MSIHATKPNPDTPLTSGMSTPKSIDPTSTSCFPFPSLVDTCLLPFLYPPSTLQLPQTNTSAGFSHPSFHLGSSPLTSSGDGSVNGMRNPARR